MFEKLIHIFIDVILVASFVQAFVLLLEAIK